MHEVKLLIHCVPDWGQVVLYRLGLVWFGFFIVHL
jgi:hypothetical protein